MVIEKCFFSRQTFACNIRLFPMTGCKDLFPIILFPPHKTWLSVPQRLRNYEIYRLTGACRRCARENLVTCLVCWYSACIIPYSTRPLYLSLYLVYFILLGHVTRNRFRSPVSLGKHSTFGKTQTSHNGRVLSSFLFMVFFLSFFLVGFFFNFLFGGRIGVGAWERLQEGESREVHC